MSRTSPSHARTSGLGFVVEGRPAGEGMLDIPALLALLQAHGRDPNAIVELWPPAEATLDDTIDKERRWVEESVALHAPVRS